MVAMLAFGGTFAYFTATANNATGTAKTALIKLTNKTETLTVVKDNALPGETIFKEDIALEDGSTRDTYVYAKVTVTFGGTAVALTDATKVVITIGDGVKWTALTGENAGVYTYSQTVGAELKLPVEVKLAEGLKENYVQGTSTDDGMQYMNKEVKVTIQFASVQQGGGVASAEAGLAQVTFADVK